ncbi:hypothetical protein RB594_007735 [Gaeumannomyces avenae]
MDTKHTASIPPLRKSGHQTGEIAGHPHNSSTRMGSRRELIVAIDFGTTFTGVCWMETSRPLSPNVIGLWPGEGGTRKSSPKVPSELLKTGDTYQWGFQIPHQTAAREKLFKLRLHDDDTPSDALEAETLTKIYLSCLHKHVWEALTERFSAEVLRSVPIHFVITVPAIWTESAKSKTLDAARDAGFRGDRETQVVSEPEAAAIYTLVDKKDAAMLEVGKRYVVCDAGGGTVDLITYKITQMRELTVEEVTEGNGGKWGSAVLNKRFRDYLKNKHPAYWDEAKLYEPMQEFEVYKKTWHPKAPPMVLVVDQSIDSKYQRFEVPQKDMAEIIFEPIIQHVLDLIRGQIEAAGDGVAAVLMVGGFSESNYLRRRVQEAVDHQGIAVLQPESPWTAVVRGAAMMGLRSVAPHLGQIQVTSRVARKSYGVELSVPFDDKVHDKSKRYRDRNGLKYLVKMMNWFIIKGESYPENDVTKFDFVYNIPNSRLGMKPDKEMVIYCHSASTLLPVHRNKDTIKIAHLRLDKSRVSQKALKEVGRHWAGFHRYHRIAGALEVSYGSALIEYTVKLAGKVHDAITVDYDEDMSKGDTESDASESGLWGVGEDSDSPEPR